MHISRHQILSHFSIQRQQCATVNTKIKNNNFKSSRKWNLAMLFTFSPQIINSLHLALAISCMSRRHSKFPMRAARNPKLPNPTARHHYSPIAMYVQINKDGKEFVTGWLLPLTHHSIWLDRSMCTVGALRETITVEFFYRG